MNKVEKLVNIQCILGESPVYDIRTGIFSWVDIKASAIYFLNLNGDITSLKTGQYVGAAVPTARGYYIAAMTTGLYCLSIDAEHFELLANSMPPNLRQRYNDAKCDASGRLWCGTMGLFGRTTEGALYQVRGDGSRQTLLQDIGISNGLAWSQDNKTMYYIDSMTYGVDAFNFNLQKGLISERRRVIDISSGLPDGMTIDAEGMLWIAIWGESCVRRYNPIDGALLDIVEIPSKFVTSCCFGGVDMDTLYITTSAEREMENKDAGCVYCLQPGVKGFPSVPFDDIERMN